MSEIKSLQDISWQVSEEEYRADHAYSYSTIAKFNREGFDKLNTLFDKVESPSLVFGSMVDTLLTDGIDSFNEKFITADFPVISDTLALIAKKLFADYSEKYKSIREIPDQILSNIGAECEYYTNSKYDSYRVKMIKENCETYYQLLYLTIGKKLVSQLEYQAAINCVQIIKDSPATSFYFAPNLPFDKTIERFYQLKFKGVYEGIELRCMSDLIVVDHKAKTVQPIDLKTSYNKEWNFYHSFVTWGYWIQAQLYWEIIYQNMMKDDVYKDYTLLDYKFIVVSKDSLKPLCWTYRDTKAIVDIQYGKNQNIKCRNWRNIVKELHYYLTNDCQYPIGITEDNDLVTFLNYE